MRPWLVARKLFGRTFRQRRVHSRRREQCVPLCRLPPHVGRARHEAGPLARQDTQHHRASCRIGVRCRYPRTQISLRCQRLHDYERWAQRCRRRRERFGEQEEGRVQDPARHLQPADTLRQISHICRGQCSRPAHRPLGRDTEHRRPEETPLDLAGRYRLPADPAQRSDDWLLHAFRQVYGGGRAARHQPQEHEAPVVAPPRRLQTDGVLRRIAAQGRGLRVHKVRTDTRHTHPLLPWQAQQRRSRRLYARTGRKTVAGR